MKLKCVIIEDEQGAQLVLKEYIRQAGDVELCGTFGNAIEAFHFLKQNKVDVLLLDINMPQVSGFGLLDMMNTKPAVIFTTAYSEYAFKAFDYNVVDYLHKPIRFERFVLAIDKARKWCTLQQTDKPEHLELKIDGRLTEIKLSGINHIESLGNYLKIHTANNSQMVLMTMNEIESRLPKDMFVRVHKSYIVNTLKISELGDNELSINGKKIPVGKTYKRYFEESLRHKKGN